MKRIGLKIVVAIVVGATTASSFAQTAPTAAATPAPDCPAAAPAPACNSCGCDSCGTWFDLLGGQCPLNCPDQPTKRLFENNCWLKCHDISVTGLIDAGIAGRDGSRGDGFNGPDGFNDFDGTGQLNEIDTVVTKAVKPTGCCWDWGFTVETIYGADYRYPLALGLDARDNGTPKWNTDPRDFYGLAMPQAYLEFATTKLDWKIGHFNTLLCYEVDSPSGNFFYSHTYTFIYDPFTHTGILGTYTKDAYWTFNFGINEGWNNFDDTDHHLGYMGGVTVKSCDKKTTLEWVFEDSDEPITPGSVSGPVANCYLQSIVLTKNLTDRATWVLENVDGFQDRGARDGGTSSWFGLTDYLTYKLNCCWSTGLRTEWFRDTNGTRVDPVGDFTVPPTPGSDTASVGGFAGNFYDITYGFNYKPSGNLTIRPEIRYDCFSGADLNGVKPYLSGTSDHQWVYAVDAVVLF